MIGVHGGDAHHHGDDVLDRVHGDACDHVEHHVSVSHDMILDNCVCQRLLQKVHTNELFDHLLELLALFEMPSNFKSTKLAIIYVCQCKTVMSSAKSNKWYDLQES